LSRTILLIFGILIGAFLGLSCTSRADARRNPAYPMNAQATQPPPMPDLDMQPGYMYDTSRWTAYNTVEDMMLCTPPPDIQCGVIPAGTVLLVPALRDSI